MTVSGSLLLSLDELPYDPIDARALDYFPWPRVAGMPVVVDLGHVGLAPGAARVIAGRLWTACDVDVIGSDRRSVRELERACRDYERRALCPAPERWAR